MASSSALHALSHPSTRQPSQLGVMNRWHPPPPPTPCMRRCNRPIHPLVATRTSRIQDCSTLAHIPQPWSIPLYRYWLSSTLSSRSPSWCKVSSLSDNSPDDPIILGIPHAQILTPWHFASQAVVHEWVGERDKEACLNGLKMWC